MTSFVYDNTAVPDGKSDLKPLTGTPAKYVTAAEWNTVMQALKDLRTAILTGDYHGLASNPSATVSPAGGVKLRSNAGTLEVSQNGASYSSIASTLAEPGWKTADSLGIKTTNTAEANSLAIEAAMEAMAAADESWHITFGPGIYYFNRTLEVKKTCTLEGVGPTGVRGTNFYFPNNGDDGVRLWYFTPVGRKLKFKLGSVEPYAGDVITSATGSATVYKVIGQTTSPHSIGGNTWHAGTATGTLQLTGVTGYFADNQAITSANRPTLSLDVDTGTAEFKLYDTVIGASGGRGTIYDITGKTGTWDSGTHTGACTLLLVGVTGSFSNNDAVAGVIQGAALANGTGTVGHINVTLTADGADIASPYVYNSTGSEIRHLQLVQSGHTNGGSALRMLTMAKVSHVYAEQWSDIGFAVTASTGDNSNANDFMIDYCKAGSCGSHGFFADGADSNAGNFVGCTSTSNTGWGFYDSSFLGNTYLGCEVDGNAAGSYKTEDQNARCVLIGCYVEGYQAPYLAENTIWLGGLSQTRPTGPGVSLVDSRWNVINVQFPTSTADYIQIGKNDYFRIANDEQVGAYHAYRHSTGFYEWYDTAWAQVGQQRVIYGGTLNGRWALPATSNFPIGLYIKGQRIFASNVPPSASGPANYNFAVGDICLNDTPAVGSPVGWQCTVAGTGGSYTEGKTATTDGTTAVVMSAPSSIGYIQVGSKLTINGTTGTVLSVNADYKSAGVTTLTMSGAIAAGAGLAITYSPPTFKPFGIVSDTKDDTGTPGAATQNTTSGRVAVAIGANNVVITNSLITTTSKVFATLQTVDATFTQILSVVPTANTITITGNGNATAATNIAWELVY